jgi:coenzyme F420-reducing hydrogenase delta subunit
MEKGFEPEIIAFCCSWCGYGAADLAGDSRIEYPSNVKIVRVPCSGRVDSLLILQTFRDEADGVIVVGCQKDCCHNVTGSRRAEQRVKKLKKALDNVGLNGKRVETCFLSAAMAHELAAKLSEFTESVRKLGPSPLRRLA